MEATRYMCRSCGTLEMADSVLICPECGRDMCPTCGTECPHDPFADLPNVGLGPDGFTHSDPFCQMIAPFDSYEYRHGELCERCIEREDANE